MAYTPELSIYHSAVLRRLAWALKRPMTETLFRALDHVVDMVDGHVVCGMCRDDSFCDECPFKHETKNNEQLIKQSDC
jgi:hypothetical protein